MAAGDVPHQVRQRLRHPGGAGLLQHGEQPVRGAPGVQGPPDRVLGEPVDRRRAAGLHLGGEVDLGGQGRRERPGGHGGEVGLEQQVVDGLGEQVREQPGGPGRVPVEQRAGRRRERALAGEPEPGRLVEQPRDQVVAAGSGAAGGAVVEAGQDLLRARGPVGRHPGELEQHVPSQRRRARPAHLVRQRPAHRAAAVPGPDERGDGLAGQPRRRQGGPAHLDGLLGPRVGGRVGSQDGDSSPSASSRPAAWATCRTSAATRLVHVQGHRDPAQLAHAQPAGPAGREGGPSGHAQRLRDQAHGLGRRGRRGVRGRPGPHRGRPRRAAARWPGAVGAPAPQGQADLAGDHDPAGSRTASMPRASSQPTGPSAAGPGGVLADRGAPGEPVEHLGRPGRRPARASRSRAGSPSSAAPLPSARTGSPSSPRPRASARPVTRAGLRRSSTCSSGGPRPAGCGAEHLAGHPDQPQRARGAPDQGEPPQPRDLRAGVGAPRAAERGRASRARGARPGPRRPAAPARPAGPGRAARSRGSWPARPASPGRWGPARRGRPAAAAARPARRRRGPGGRRRGCAAARDGPGRAPVQGSWTSAPRYAAAARPPGPRRVPSRGEQRHAAPGRPGRAPGPRGRPSGWPTPWSTPSPAPARSSSPSPAARTPRWCSPRPSAPWARPRGRRHRRVRRRARARRSSPPGGWPTTWASAGTSRAPTRWPARATAPTAATAATSARPSSCRSSSRSRRSWAWPTWPPAPTPTTCAPGFRPGIRAAAEVGALTPLADAGLSKAEVRALSAHWDLPTWDKPAAACLSSRIAYGIPITPGPAAPGRARRGRGPRPARRPRPATCGCATSATAPPGSSSTRLPGLARRRAPRRRGRARCAAQGHDQVELRAFRSGAMNDLLAAPELFR